MDGNIQKALWLGVGILIFLAVVAMGMAALSAGQELSDNSLEKMNETTQVLANADLAPFDSSYVDGTQVMNLIKNRRDVSDGVVIRVTNGSGTIDYDSGSITDAQVKAMQTRTSANAYINPNGNFYATLVKDSNGSVSMITIVQE